MVWFPEDRRTRSAKRLWNRALLFHNFLQNAELTAWADSWPCSSFRAPSRACWWG